MCIKVAAGRKQIVGLAEESHLFGAVVGLLQACVAAGPPPKLSPDELQAGACFKAQAPLALLASVGTVADFPDLWKLKGGPAVDRPACGGFALPIPQSIQTFVTVCTNVPMTRCSNS